MTQILRCNDASLTKWLLSNPPPAHARNGVMVVLCNGLAFDWPKVAAGYEDGQRGMEAA